MAAKMATKDMENTEMAITSLFNSNRNVLLCVLACMCCPPNNKRGDISMGNDVCKSKMAAKVATTNMEIIKITITSLFNSLRNVLLVYTHVLSPREYERKCINDNLLLLLLLHRFPLLCGVDVSFETPPSRPVLRVLL